MKFSSHAFDISYLPKLYNFLGEVRQAVANSHYLHVGDLCWQVFHMLATHKASDIIQLWHDEQETLLGFVLIYPDFGVFDLQVHPDFRQMELESDMLTWAQSGLRELSDNSTLYSLVNEHDSLRKTILETNNYEKLGDWLYMQRSLASLPPVGHIAPAFRVSDMTEVGFDTRAEALGLAFNAPARPQLYQQFMTAPGYDPQLDIVTVDSRSQAVAFAMCWIDPISKDGEFEPVGTAPEFHRQGLGKATLFEGIRRMKDRDMQSVIVIVDATEVPALRLYESIGFLTRWKLFLYGKSSETGA